MNKKGSIFHINCVEEKSYSISWDIWCWSYIFIL